MALESFKVKNKESRSRGVIQIRGRHLTTCQTGSRGGAIELARARETNRQRQVALPLSSTIVIWITDRYFVIKRRNRKPAAPANTVPKSNIEVGSGTADVPLIVTMSKRTVPVEA